MSGDEIRDLKTTLDDIKTTLSEIKEDSRGMKVDISSIQREMEGNTSTGNWGFAQRLKHHGERIEKLEEHKTKVRIESGGISAGGGALGSIIFNFLKSFFS